MLQTTNVTASLIGSFVFEPDALRIWACDTQGWQTLTPALTGTGRPNLVEWVWSTATSRYVRGGQFFLDSSEDIDNPYTGNQARVEGCGAGWHAAALSACVGVRDVYIT